MINIRVTDILMSSCCSVNIVNIGHNIHNVVILKLFLIGVDGWNRNIMVIFIIAMSVFFLHLYGVYTLGRTFI